MESDGSRSGSSLSLRGVPSRPDAAAVTSGPASLVPSSTHSSQASTGSGTGSTNASASGQRSVHRSISATSSKTGRRASSGGETREAASNASASGAAANAVAATASAGSRASTAVTPQGTNHNSTVTAPTNFFRRQNTVDSATIKETSARLGAANATGGGPTGVRPLASPAAIKNATANATGAQSYCFYVCNCSGALSFLFFLSCYFLISQRCAHLQLCLLCET